jgi:hypothetical protein
MRFVMDPTKEQHQILSNLRKRKTETLAMIRQAFKEEYMSPTQVFEWHAGFRVDRKRCDR